MASVGKHRDLVRAHQVGGWNQVRGSETLREGRGLRSRLPFAEGLRRDLTRGALDRLSRVLRRSTSLYSAASPGCGGESEGGESEGEDSRATPLRAWECAASGLPPSPC